MAVDEFGREIPGGRHHHHHHHHRRGASPSPPHSRGDGAPTQLFEALSSSRYGRDEPRQHSSNNRKRKHRSESPPRGRGGKPKQSHPSTLYAEEPMLCQYLWKEANPGKEEQEYDEYRRSYCLNYVRTFFNEHMDDSWFRSLYSPLGKYRVAAQEQERAIQESRLFQSELETSLAKNQSTDDSTPCFFVLKARLGGGVKQSRNQKDDTNAVPPTHMLGVASQVLPILEVPAHVTDEQLSAALMSHCTLDKSAVPDSNSMTMYSSTPGTDLTRTCYFFAPEEVRKSIINQLNHIGRGDNNANNAAADGAHVPRKEDTYLPKTLELDVECSDAYGRLEVDSDGKGGAPEDGQGISPRKAVVWVSTQPITPPVKVLSVAVSSKERLEQDKEAAVQLAKAYDTKRNIPKEYQLEMILPKAFPETKDAETEDVLDLSIAYLRRVHLFSFYNGCVASSNMADVLSGSHAASTIHLRLSNADEILLQTKNSDATTATNATTTTAETSTEAPKLDMLVQRLNDARDKAIGETNEWNGVTCTVIVNEEVDGQAKDIEKQEAQVEDGWIQDHALIDEDGRARCSFHFCRKLFKDSTFLRKHLIKKHSEFLKAEVAKCHDTYMMTSWDKQEQRPVPPILVDCGRAFSSVPSPVLGAAEPMAADPEPELWRRQEERRKQDEEEEQARRERYNHHRQNNNNHDHHGPPPSLDAPLSEGRGGPRNNNNNTNNFVDVDDMKEEKVEMAFDQVEIPTMEPPKKKKKKKKLL